MSMRLAVRDDYLVFGAPRIEAAEIAEVVDCLQSGWLGTGPKVARFEEIFRQYTGADHALALNSCTAGLHLAMVAAGIGHGDEVITTPMTFCATANAIVHTGATPVFVDCDRHTGLIDPQRIEEAVTRRTRAILPIHLYGRPCAMDEIEDIARRHNLIIIEDAAHAIEARYRGRKVGSIGTITCFSFYVTKNVVTGEGGMVTTNVPEYAERIKVMGLHGMTRDAWKRFSDDGYRHYQVVSPGFKYNMMDLQAALGIHQMQRVEERWRRRDEIWRTYCDGLADLGVDLPPPDEKDTRHARHLFTLTIHPSSCGRTRDEFMHELHQMNIGTGVHYIGVHLQPYYRQRFGFSAEDFPNATYLSERTLSLPLSPALTDEDVEYVMSAVRHVIATAYPSNRVSTAERCHYGQPFLYRLADPPKVDDDARIVPSGRG